MKAMKNCWNIGVILVLVVLLAVVACAKATPTPTKGPPTATPTPTMTSTPTAGPAATPTPTATATPKPTATPTPTASPAKPEFHGNFVFGDIMVPPPVFLPSKQGTGNDQLYNFWGFTEGLMWNPYSAPPKMIYEPGNEGIAESWEIAPDGSSVTFKIRKGVMFHHGWGELTAHDVVWSYQNAGGEGSISSRYHGIRLLAGGPEGWSAPDDWTVVMKIVEAGLSPDWYRTLGNNALGTVSIVSKRLYDEKGEEAAISTDAGTGPVQSVEWVSEDHILAEPFKLHYRKIPSIQSMKIVMMPETSTRIAALKTGQIHMARIPLKFIPDLEASIPGAWTQQVGFEIGQIFAFGGNYWADVWMETGEDIYRKRGGFKPDADHPWIGDPDDPAQMEKAMKFRKALNLAVDREAIIRNVQAGLGRPYYDLVNAFPGDDHWKDEWFIPYDPDGAKALLAEAGVSQGFHFKVHIAPGKEWDVEACEAVAQFWREIGLNVEVDRTAYAAARPMLVERTKDIPWVIQQGTGMRPDGVPGDSWRPSIGFNIAIELPNEITAISDRNRDVVGTTYEERIANVQAWNDYVMTEWWLAVPITGLPNVMVVRPEVVEWKPYMNNGPEFVSPETIVMK